MRIVLNRGSIVIRLTIYYMFVNLQINILSQAMYVKLASHIVLSCKLLISQKIDRDILLESDDRLA